VVKTAQLSPLGAGKVLSFHLVRAFLLLESQWVIQVFNKSVAIGAVKLVWTVLPVTIFTHIGTSLLCLVEKHAGWSSEVLLSVGEVAVTPLMLLVDERTE
jgi:hypothetical protein